MAGMGYRSCRYFVCSECKSGYSDIYYTENELSAIYSGYRGEDYLRTRSNWESTYTPQLNNSLDTGTEVFELRKEAMSKLLLSVDSTLSLKATCVIDIGGGHGSLMPDWPLLSEKFVLDVSDVKPVRGIRKIASLQELDDGTQVDLIMCCMVLEHLNSPRDFLLKLRESFLFKVANPERTLFYIEVPAGVPIRKPMILKYLLMKLLSNFPSLWKILDRKITRFPNNFPLRIAEHIQFFTPVGLEKMLEKSGFLPLDISSYSSNFALEDSSGIRFGSTNAVVAKVNMNFGYFR